MTIPKSERSPFQLPSGKYLDSNDPVDEWTRHYKKRFSRVYWRHFCDSDKLMDKDRRSFDLLLRSLQVSDDVRAKELMLTIDELPLFDAEVAQLNKELQLTELWVLDMELRRQGITSQAQRREKMGITFEENLELNGTVSRFELNIWKKLTVVYADMCASSLFDQVIFLRNGRLYSRGKIFTPSEI